MPIGDKDTKNIAWSLLMASVEADDVSYEAYTDGDTYGSLRADRMRDIYFKAFETVCSAYVGLEEHLMCCLLRYRRIKGLTAWGIKR